MEAGTPQIPISLVNFDNFIIIINTEDSISII